MNEGWSKPNRPIKKRSGHARWSHYFIDRKSLCGRWTWQEHRDPEPITRNEVFARDCLTCRNKLAKIRSSKFINGWLVPDEDTTGRSHYFREGLSLCSRFIQNKEPQPENELRANATEFCSYCNTLREHDKILLEKGGH